MPADFVGLSYEVQQLADPSFFAASNIGLIRQFKALAPRGRAAPGRQYQRVCLGEGNARFS
jgi:hypothetical protein